YLGYLGITTVTLGLLAISRGVPKAVLFGVLVALLGVVLALGENSGVYALLFGSVPGFDTFRVPARWLLLWEFGAAVLAAGGADWIGGGAHVVVRSRWFWPRLAL